MMYARPLTPVDFAAEPEFSLRFRGSDRRVRGMFTGQVRRGPGARSLRGRVQSAQAVLPEGGAWGERSYDELWWIGGRVLKFFVGV